MTITVDEPTLRRLIREEVQAVHQPLPEWLPTREAARHLRVTPRTLRTYAQRSPVIVRRPGDGRAPDMYLRASLDAFVNTRPSPCPRPRLRCLTRAHKPTPQTSDSSRLSRLDR